jgi:outer membrane protein
MNKTHLSFVAVLSLVSALVCASPVLVNVAQADEAVKIGTVDMQHALQTVEAGKKAKAQLEKEFNSRKKDLQSEEASIKKMGEEFKKQAAVMNEDARTKKQAEIQERIMKFQETTARSQQEIQQKEHELTQPIINKLRGVIADVAKNHGYTVVLEKNENTVLYSLDKDDLTEEAITAFNKANKVQAAGSPASSTLDRG